MRISALALVRSWFDFGWGLGGSHAHEQASPRGQASGREVRGHLRRAARFCAAGASDGQEGVLRQVSRRGREGSPAAARTDGAGVRGRRGAQDGAGRPGAAGPRPERPRADGRSAEGRGRSAERAEVAHVPRVRRAVRTGSYRHVPQATYGHEVPQHAASIYPPRARGPAARRGDRRRRPAGPQQAESDAVRGELHEGRAQRDVRRPSGGV